MLLNSEKIWKKKKFEVKIMHLKSSMSESCYIVFKKNSYVMEKIEK